MHHLTLNTGHCRQSPRTEVRDSVLEALRPLCEPGAYELSVVGPGWTVEVVAGECGGLLFTVSYRGEPIVTCGVAGDPAAADEVWPLLEALYLEVTDRAPHRPAHWQAPRRPDSTPWLAVVLVSFTPIYFAASWLGDFERCLAWAWLSRS